ncbi:MAG: VOC family protein [Solirubrobacterales bacterium]|nr:VOC family protein [Solirubrobacterales bacterium]
MELDGLHHISAITGDARLNLAFYTGVLGLRLTAKTVNQDDPSVYHLFYGDERARPGADLTFFEYPNAVPGRPGAGMVHTIVSRVGSASALDFWAARLAGNDVAVERTAQSVRFADPEGLKHELVVPRSTDAPLIAEHPEIPAEHRLQGFEGVRAYSAYPEGSGIVLERLMGATAPGPSDAWIGGEEAWELRTERRGGWIAFDPAPAEPGRQSAGTVHHIAWSTRDEELQGWIDAVTDAGLPNSGYVDRHYFHSLYFREPGGILYELATAEPGFLVDGLSLDELGTRIILPPFLESQRAAAEAKLTPLSDPRASWTTPR